MFFIERTVVQVYHVFIRVKKKRKRDECWYKRKLRGKRTKNEDEKEVETQRKKGK